MFDKLLDTLSTSEVAASISNQLDMLAGFIDGYLTGMDNLRMASFILMILALLLFLFLIIIIYIKTIVAFLRDDNDANSLERQDGDEEEDIFDEEDQLRLNQVIDDKEREQELEKELQKELELAHAERIAEEKEQRQLDTLKKQPAKEEKIKSNEKNAAIKLDWEKGKFKELDALAQNIEIRPDILSYHQSNRQINELVGLIIDMIGRGVDDLKIAQTILFRNQYMSSEEDVLQLIDAVKDFIGLCKNQEFSKLENYSSLPHEEEALYHLAEGDASLALAMIEALMNNGIDHASALSADAKRESLYLVFSRQAVIF